jgi:ppGpp synthetase/RelA/SpoT-type nucleotidyltranferase
MVVIENMYNSLVPILTELERQVANVLGLHAQRHGFLLSHRVKAIESVLDKIETGRYRSLSDFDDLVAFSIIIDTRSQHKETLGFLKRAFAVIEVRGKSTLSDERMFDFDATRVYARLVLSDPSSPIAGITFEVQIRTLLQHAWSKITHPLVYKARQVDSRGIRLAAEILANMEGIDRSLSTFATVARGVKRVTRLRSTQLNAIVAMIDDLVEDGTIPSEVRPNNGRRFGENLLSMIDLRKNKFEDAMEVIKAFYKSQGSAFPRSVTLNQVALIALKRAGMLAPPARNRPRYYYITQAMISLYPDAASIMPQVTP